MNNWFVVFQDWFWLVFGPILSWVLVSLIALTVFVSMLMATQRILSTMKGGK